VRIKILIAFLCNWFAGQDYRSSEKGKLVLYTTGVKVVRDTYDKCLRVKKILQTHMVRYEERDVSMSRDNHRQLAERLGPSAVELPQVFADGLHIGVNLDLSFYACVSLLQGGPENN